jgi:hypothetical protein
MRTTLLSLIVVVGTFGCAHQKEMKEGEHPAMSSGVKLFHDVISPVYHQDKSASRDEQTCAATPKLKEATAAIAAEPGADKTKSDALGQALSTLETACRASGRADVAAKLELLHDAFHAVMEASH